MLPQFLPLALLRLSYSHTVYSHCPITIGTRSDTASYIANKQPSSIWADQNCAFAPRLFISYFVCLPKKETRKGRARRVSGYDTLRLNECRSHSINFELKRPSTIRIIALVCY
ncbi:hypothetical protein GGI35DRAFT_449427 [Trichoderma velutinum]